MNRRAFTPLFLSLVLTATILIQVQGPIRSNYIPRKEIPELGGQQAVETYGKLPLSFEANQGQADPQVKFLSRGNGYTVFLNSTEAVRNLKIPESSRLQRTKRLSRDRQEKGNRSVTSESGVVLRMQLIGANPTVSVDGAEELAGKSNYLMGNDPSKWHINMPTYTKVRYRGIYPGIDMICYGTELGILEYDLSFRREAILMS